MFVLENLNLNNQVLPVKSAAQSNLQHNLHKFIKVKLIHLIKKIAVIINYILYVVVFVCLLGPVTRFFQKTVFPVLLPGLAALLTEARNHGCFEVYISSHTHLTKNINWKPTNVKLPCTNCKHYIHYHLNFTNAALHLLTQTFTFYISFNKNKMQYNSNMFLCVVNKSAPFPQRKILNAGCLQFTTCFYCFREK